MTEATETTTDPFALTDPLEDRIKFATHDSPQCRFERARHSNSGWCLRCGMSNVPGKFGNAMIHYEYEGVKSAVLPLCSECFPKVTTDEIREYCIALFRSWRGGHLSCAFNKWIAVDLEHPHLKAILSGIKR